MRLIDADALMNTLQELFDKREKEQMFTGSRGAFVTWNDAICHFKSAPTIDAVAIVRCGNCAKRGKNGKGIPGGCPFGMTDDTCDPNAYCSYGVLRMKTGERKDNGT